jgi:hypothetical protein
MGGEDWLVDEFEKWESWIADVLVDEYRFERRCDLRLLYGAQSMAG